MVLQKIFPIVNARFELIACNIEIIYMYISYISY